MMNRKKLFTITIAGGVLLLVGILGFVYLQQNNSIVSWQNRSDGTVCDFEECHFSAVTQEYNKWLKRAVDNEDVSFCSNVTGVEDSGQIYDAAEAQKLCAFSLAVKLKDPTRCEQLEAPDKTTYYDQASCYDRMVEIFNDTTYCEKTHSPESCYHEYTTQAYAPSLCQPLQQPFKDECIRKAAVENKDATICEQLSQPNEQPDCVDRVSLGEAAMCSLMQTQERGNQCVMTISAHTNTPTMCLEIFEGYGTRGKDSDRCFLHTAVLSKDYDLCEQLTPYSWISKNQCYQEMAIVLDDPSLCDKVSPSLKADCLENVNLPPLEDVESCQNLNNPDQVVNCVKNASVNAKDISACLELSEYYDVLDCEVAAMDSLHAL